MGSVIMLVKFHILAILVCLPLVACGKSSYSFQMWTYPETAKAHEPGWMYLGKTLIYDKPGLPPTKPVEKRCIITIVDQGKKELLHDEPR
jgi:hypothetical protein